MLKETPWKQFSQGKQKYRIKAEYGIDYDFAKRNNQAPYFSITAEIDRAIPGGRWYDDSGGMLHDEIAFHFPKLEPYLKWHLVGEDGPMHYIANAKYWLDVATGKISNTGNANPTEAFYSTIVMGALPDDTSTIPDFLEASWAEFKQWLEERLPRLMEAWRDDMEKLGVLEG